MKTPCMRWRCGPVTLVGLLAATATGCLADAGEHDHEQVVVNGGPVAFQEWKQAVYQEPDTGVYIVEGDLPLRDDHELRDYFYRNVAQAALVVVRTGSPAVDDIWPASQKDDLTYCIKTSDFTATELSALKTALSDASAAWERAADGVDFRYRSSEDGNCSATNGNVLFRVRAAPAGAPYGARAFFRHWAQKDYELLINRSAAFVSPGSSGFASFTTEGMITHELGHILGFDHEYYHADQRTGTWSDGTSVPAVCSTEPSQAVRDATPYDRWSTMNYAECTGPGSGTTGDPAKFTGELSFFDRTGVACLYTPADSWYTCDPELGAAQIHAASNSALL